MPVRMRVLRGVMAEPGDNVAAILARRAGATTRQPRPPRRGVGMATHHGEPAMSRIVLSLAAVLLAASACFPAAARTLVDVSIVDRDEGRPMPQYRHEGERWLAGVPGHRYAVRLANTSGERVLVVLSVDGVNAVTGEDADPSQTGYVLEPWQSTEITGWRKSLDEVAQFHFTRLPDSYAARTGRPDNVGVIGIAVFRERRPPRIHIPPYPYPVRPQARMDTEGARATAAAEAA